MARTLTPAVVTQTVAAAVEPFGLAVLAFDSGTVRLWNGIGDLVWQGDTYTGVGTYGAVSPVKETTDLRADGVVLQLSGIPSELLSLALGERYQGRTMTLYAGFFDGATPPAIVGDPFIIFQGRMDVMGIREGADTSEITLHGENRNIVLRRSLGLRLTDQDQRRTYPNDAGFEFVTALQDQELVWGG